MSAHHRISTDIEDRWLEGVDLEHKPIWSPNPDADDGTPNPQRSALESEADELFYGGAAGGGKSDLLLGLAFTRHKKAVIFRRVHPNLTELIDRSIELVDEPSAYNQTSKRWRWRGRSLHFSAVQYERDRQNWQGRPHDLYGFDEITEFSRSQYIFIIGWNRSIDLNQRCRVVVTGNPPIDEAGSWVIDEWAPWLDPEFDDPAKPGELRWYYRDGDRLVWLKSGDPIDVEDETIYPRSRTFIPANLRDNPWLSADSRYLSVLQSLPKELKAAFLYGDFGASLEPDPWQVIPTEWVRIAQRRWLETPRPDMLPTAFGLDVARGGKDATALGERFSAWFDVQSWPGVDTPDGPTVAALVAQRIAEIGMPQVINVDVIGIGSSAFDSLVGMYQPDTSDIDRGRADQIVFAVNVGAGSSYVDERSKSLQMRNKRAEMYWRMREALDPDHGYDVSLPPGNEVLADLCAAKYKMVTSGIQIEAKDDIKGRIGRSPDVGEALMLANMPPTLPEQKKRAWAR